MPSTQSLSRLLFVVVFLLLFLPLLTTKGISGPSLMQSSIAQKIGKTATPAVAASGDGHIVIQYEMGDSRVLRCPYWARTVEGDCYPFAYRLNLILMWGVPNFLLAALTLCGGMLYLVCGKCYRQPPPKQHGAKYRIEKMKKERSKNQSSTLLSLTNESSMRCKNKEVMKQSQHKHGLPVTGILSHAPEDEENNTGNFLSTGSAASSGNHNNSTSDENHPPLPSLENCHVKKCSNSNNNSRAGKSPHHHSTTPKDLQAHFPSPHPLLSSPSSSSPWGMVCELFFLPWFLSVVVFLSTIVLCCFAVTHTNALVANMEFLSTQVDRAQGVLLQLGDQLDDALQQVVEGSGGGGGGANDDDEKDTRIVNSYKNFAPHERWLSSFSTPVVAEVRSRERVSEKEEVLGSSASSSSSSLQQQQQQAKWSTQLYPQLGNQLYDLRHRSIDYLVRTVKNVYFLSIWTYSLFFVLFLLSGFLFLVMMRCWDSRGAFRMFIALFVIFGALTWVWVGYHRIVLEFLRDSCLEIEYYTKQQSNVLSAVTFCGRSSSGDFLASYFNFSSKSTDNALSETDAERGSSKETPPSKVSSPSLWTGENYFQEIRQTYMAQITYFACRSITSDTESNHNIVDTEIKNGKAAQEVGWGVSGAVEEETGKGTESNLCLDSSNSEECLSRCRKALSEEREKMMTIGIASLTAEQQNAYEEADRRITAVDFLLSNFTFCSAITSCNGILAVAVPPLLGGCEEAVRVYQVLVKCGGGIGLTAIVGTFTAGITLRRQKKIQNGNFPRFYRK